jgi:hypothetical protein
MRPNRAGLTLKSFGTLPISPPEPLRDQVAQAGRFADKRKLIKDEKDEALTERF